MRLTPLILLLALAHAAPPRDEGGGQAAGARRRAAPPDARVIENLTQGFRFAPPFIVLAEAPSSPEVLYLASGQGRLFSTLDGGVSWEEFNLLTARKGFYGARRPQGMVPWWNITLGRGAPKERTPGHVLAVESPDIIDRYEAANRHTRSEFNQLVNPSGFSLTLAKPFGSPRPAGKLAWWVRKRKGWALGVKLKLQLFMRSGPATSINFVSVHPSDAQDILAGTSDGLYRSRNAGYSWALVLTGASKDERLINHITRDLKDPNVAYCATGRGMYLSRDGGDTWAVSSDAAASRNHIRWITINPKDPQEMLLGMTWGILKSTDGGARFNVIFTHSWPALKFIHHISYDPNNTRRVLVATRDGLLVSEDGGKKFERGGGGLFIGQNIESISSGVRPGHFILATQRDLWESFDGGKEWRAVLFGANQWNIRDARFSDHDGEVIWIVTSAEILRLRPGHQLNPEGLVSSFRLLQAKEPTLGGVIKAGLERARVDRPYVNNYRRWAGLSMYIPNLYVMADQLKIDVENDRDIFGERFFRATGKFSLFYWSAWLRMDLAKVVFNKNESTYDLPGAISRDAERKIRETLTNLYQERRRLQLQALQRPNERGRAKLMRDLRLEELTAHINALAGDLLAPFSAL